MLATQVQPHMAPGYPRAWRALGLSSGTKRGLCHHDALRRSCLHMPTPDVACGRGVVCYDDLPSLSARLAWKEAILYTALERAHLFTPQGRALQRCARGRTRAQAPASEARASSETVRMPRRDTV